MSDFSIVKVFNHERHTPWKYTLRILVNLLGFQVNHWDFDGSQSDFHMLNPTVRLAGGHISTASRSTRLSPSRRPRARPHGPPGISPSTSDIATCPRNTQQWSHQPPHPDPPWLRLRAPLLLRFRAPEHCRQELPRPLVQPHRLSRYSSSNVRVVRSSTSQKCKAGVLAKSKLEY